MADVISNFVNAGVITLDDELERVVRENLRLPPRDMETTEKEEDVIDPEMETTTDDEMEPAETMKASEKTEKKTLYTSRKVTNGSDILERAKNQGIKDLVNKNDLHVTIAFSKKKMNRSDLVVDSEKMDFDLQDAKLEKLGDAIVIKFTNKQLKAGWQKYIDLGASWDYETYMPHISVSYNNDQDISNMDNFD